MSQENVLVLIQASAAAGQANLIRQQEELERKAAELERKEQEMQNRSRATNAGGELLSHRQALTSRSGHSIIRVSAFSQRKQLAAAAHVLPCEAVLLSRL